jgi:amino acid transporter
MHRKRNKNLGLAELIAIALGGMVGGGIFTILGVSVSMIGTFTPVAIIMGGMIALLAAYSYVKLGVYYMDEGATFSFIQRTYPESHFASSLIGWFVIFGYISTLALYAYTFSSYLTSGFDMAQNALVHKTVAIGIIGVFTAVNIWSVNGMGKIEDIMVYTKLAILVAISAVLIRFGSPDFTDLLKSFAHDAGNTGVLNILIVASITFVAYEGFQLIINAISEMKQPEKNIPRGIYTAILLAVAIYVLISIGALLAIPPEEIIKNKEYALAAGAGSILGNYGSNLVIIGAVLATSSAISGTLFGASRQIAVISEKGYMPQAFSKRKRNIPVNAIFVMASVSSFLILIGGLELILEFGSITFLLVSLLISIANFKLRKETKSSSVAAVLAIGLLSVGCILILYYEFTTAFNQMLFIIALYILLTGIAFLYARKNDKKEKF